MESLPQTIIHDKIYDLRGLKVMLDSDLAILYEVETKRINEAVKIILKNFLKIFILNLQKKNLRFCGRKFRPQNLLKQELYLKYLQSRAYIC